jgi:hypothetical protein
MCELASSVYCASHVCGNVCKEVALCCSWSQQSFSERWWEWVKLDYRTLDVGINASMCSLPKLPVLTWGSKSVRPGTTSTIVPHRDIARYNNVTQ